MRRAGPARVAVALLGAVGLLCACAPEAAPEVEHPEGSVRLVDTQPRTIGDVTAVVGNVTQGSAVLSVAGDGEPAEAVDVAVGDVVELQGHTFEVVDIVEDEVSAGEGVGASTAAVWVVVDGTTTL